MTTKPTRNTPTPEKVRRRLIEHWEVIRRNPGYRRAYRERDSDILAKFGIDADPNDPSPDGLFDLLEATHTDYSIDTRQVISGVLPLCETPWKDAQGKEQWQRKREAVFILDPEVTLEEIREGIEQRLKFRRPYWLKARRWTGPVALQPVRLIAPKHSRDSEARRMRKKLARYQYRYRVPFPPVLIVDPLQPLAQMRREIHTLTKKWGAKRPPRAHRWRRTTARDIPTFDLMQNSLAQIGKQPGRSVIAKNLGLTPDQARRAGERARRVIGRPEDAVLVEHLLRCQECRTSAPCRAFDPLADRSAGLTRWPRERPASGVLDRLPGKEVPSGSRYPFRCPVCHKSIRSRADALKKHRECAQAIRSRRKVVTTTH